MSKILNIYNQIKNWIFRITKRPFEVLNEVHTKIEELLEQFGILGLIKRIKKIFNLFLRYPKQAFLMLLGLNTLANISRNILFAKRLLKRLMKFVKNYLPDEIVVYVENFIKAVSDFCSPVLSPVINLVNQTSEKAKQIVKFVFDKFFSLIKEGKRILFEKIINPIVAKQLSENFLNTKQEVKKKDSFQFTNFLQN